MKEFRRTSRSFIAFSSVILFAALLVSCSNTERDTKKVDDLEKEKIALEAKIKGLESLQQQAITAKDAEIAKLKELNEALDAQMKELQKQSSGSDNQVTDRKLSQDNAAKAIKQFVSSNSFKASGISSEAISSIEPVGQFSETEASSIVHFNYRDEPWGKGNLALKFKFQKNVDKKWILTSLESVNQSVGSQVLADWVRQNQNINIVAQ